MPKLKQVRNAVSRLASAREDAMEEGLREILGDEVADERERCALIADFKCINPSSCDCVAHQIAREIRSGN